MEVACQLDEDGVEMHPLAFRVHTHLLGTDVRGWKVGPVWHCAHVIYASIEEEEEPNCALVPRSWGEERSGGASAGPTRSCRRYST